MMKQYIILRIDEDIDYGCEERSDDTPIMAVVTLQDEEGREHILRQEDQMLYKKNINEGDVVIFDETKKIIERFKK